MTSGLRLQQGRFATEDDLEKRRERILALDFSEPPTAEEFRKMTDLELLDLRMVNDERNISRDLPEVTRARVVCDCATRFFQAQALGGDVARAEQNLRAALKAYGWAR